MKKRIFIRLLGLFILFITVVSMSLWDHWIPKHEQNTFLPGVIYSENSRPQNKSFHPLILYNRVPKTGSTTLANLIYLTGAKNNFNVALANFSRMGGVLSLDDQINFVRNISHSAQTLPVVVHGHFPFINFKKLGSPVSPLYISLVRDPIQRLVSSYYFKRFGDTFNGDKRHSRYRDVMSFDECCARNLTECSSQSLWLQIPYFCGNSLLCSEKRSFEALEMAKRRVEEEYLLVGMTEKLGAFVETLEALLPQQCHGISRLYKTSSVKKLRKTRHKDKINSTTFATLSNSFEYQLENDFYNFVARSFLKTLNRIRNRETRANDFPFKFEKIRLNS